MDLLMHWLTLKEKYWQMVKQIYLLMHLVRQRQKQRLMAKLMQTVTYLHWLMLKDLYLQTKKLMVIAKQKQTHLVMLMSYLMQMDWLMHLVTLKQRQTQMDLMKVKQKHLVIVKRMVKQIYLLMRKETLMLTQQLNQYQCRERLDMLHPNRRHQHNLDWCNGTVPNDFRLNYQEYLL